VSWSIVLRVVALAAALVGLSPGETHAHKPSDSYLRVSAGGERLRLRWDIALKDLEMVVGLDSDANGEITWGELKARQSAVFEHARSRLSISVDGKPMSLVPGRLLFDRHSDGGYAVLELGTDAPGNSRRVSITYSLLFDVDPTHRGLVLVAAQGGSGATHVLSPERPTMEIDLDDPGPWRSFLAYLREGVWHIWIGYDHVLFLLTLLLPAVLVWRERKWTPVDAFRPAAWDIAKIVSCFTLAHTITLWLAVMDHVALPSRWVESVIALSIVVTAAHNLRPVLPSTVSGWVFGFGFGLVHGFGFAAVLKDLGARDFALGSALLGFNVGVELGQLCIVLAVLPVIFLLRRNAAYPSVILRFGSITIAALAVVWFVERAFKVEILGW
jgi:HupE / UreJ protein